MVLVKPLSTKVKQRHQKLLQKYSQIVFQEPNPQIDLIDNGQEKGIYKLKIRDEEFVAAAAAIDPEQKLRAEYNILSDLYDGTEEEGKKVTPGAPKWFPRPIGHWRPQQAQELGDLFVMEYLPHTHIDKYRQENLVGVDFSKNLAYTLGRGVGEVHTKTGRHMTDPHNRNILLKNKQDTIEMKFCDAIQWKKGTLQDAVHAILNDPTERPESYRFIHKFREGLAQGLAESNNLSKQDAYASLQFVEKYNPIF